MQIIHGPPYFSPQVMFPWRRSWQRKASQKATRSSLASLGSKTTWRERSRWCLARPLLLQSSQWHVFSHHSMHSRAYWLNLQILKKNRPLSSDSDIFCNIEESWLLTADAADRFLSLTLRCRERSLWSIQWKRSGYFWRVKFKYNLSWGTNTAIINIIIISPLRMY